VEVIGVLGLGRVCAIATIFELIWPGAALSQTGAASELPPTVPSQPQPPPGSPPPAVSREHGVFLALPYLGAESHTGQSGQHFGVGFLVGALFGARLGNRFSLNGELTIDGANVKDTPTGTQAARREFDLAVSPLIHLGSSRVEVVVGPKLGLWSGTYQLTSAGRTVDSESARGLVGALNLGVFLPVSQGMSLGGLLSFTLKTFNRTCATPVGQTETCNPSPTLDSEKVLGFTAGALF
jgi:hypothetical protein